MLQNFEFLEKIGKGSFSSVYKVRRYSDNQMYALKKVKLQGLSQNEKNNALNEVRIIASVRSPYIVNFKECFLDDESEDLCIIMEYLNGGDLHQMIRKRSKDGRFFPEKEVWSALIQISRGIKVLHDMNIIHRDIKSANVFMQSDGSFKIGDFNVSKIAKTDSMLYTQTGTPYYASPEIWQKKAYDSKTDIWSLGCVIYDMCALRPPFFSDDSQEVVKNTYTANYRPLPVLYSRDIQFIIDMCLKVESKQRPPIDSIVNNDLILNKFGLNRVNNFDLMEESELLETIKFPTQFQKIQKKSVSAKKYLPRSNYQPIQSQNSINSTEKSRNSSKLKSSNDLNQSTKASTVQNYSQQNLDQSDKTLQEQRSVQNVQKQNYLKQYSLQAGYSNNKSTKNSQKNLLNFQKSNQSSHQVGSSKRYGSGNKIDTSKLKLSAPKHQDISPQPKTSINRNKSMLVSNSVKQSLEQDQIIQASQRVSSIDKKIPRSSSNNTLKHQQNHRNVYPLENQKFKEDNFYVGNSLSSNKNSSKQMVRKNSYKAVTKSCNSTDINQLIKSQKMSSNSQISSDKKEQILSLIEKQSQKSLMNSDKSQKMVKKISMGQNSISSLNLSNKKTQQQQDIADYVNQQQQQNQAILVQFEQDQNQISTPNLVKKQNQSFQQSASNIQPQKGYICLQQRVKTDQYSLSPTKKDIKPHNKSNNSSIIRTERVQPQISTANTTKNGQFSPIKLPKLSSQFHSNRQHKPKLMKKSFNIGTQLNSQDISQDNVVSQTVNINLSPRSVNNMDTSQPNGIQKSNNNTSILSVKRENSQPNEQKQFSVQQQLQQQLQQMTNPQNQSQSLKQVLQQKMSISQTSNGTQRRLQNQQQYMQQIQQTNNINSLQQQQQHIPNNKQRQPHISVSPQKQAVQEQIDRARHNMISPKKYLENKNLKNILYNNQQSNEESTQDGQLQYVQNTE